MDTIVTIDYVPDQPGDVTDDPVGAQGVVGDPQSGVDHKTADLLAAAVLAAADMDYVNGNTIKGEDLRRRYGLS